MAIDEIQAFKTASASAANRGWSWRPPFFISKEEGEWLVEADSNCVIRINESGEVLDDLNALDPQTAFSIAKAYAHEHSLGWRPAFSLALHADRWEVGSCQSQFGGQTHISVGHNGVVLRHVVNPK